MRGLRLITAVAIMRALEGESYANQLGIGSVERTYRRIRNKHRKYKRGKAKL